MKLIDHLKNMTLKRAVREVRSAFRFAFLLLPTSLDYRKKEDIWLISERPDQARDNGYCFFRFLREQHPEVQAYYLIDKKADDYKKIESLGNVIQFGSWEHYYFFLLSQKHISAHVGGCNPAYSMILRFLKNKIGYKDIFIPHGVSYGIAEFCLKKYARIDLFICSGKQEYENVLHNYGYTENEVAYTGFPRLDSWHDVIVNNKQILVMPTWRSYLAHDKKTNIRETLYFKTYQSLLNSEKLTSFLEENDLTLIFYPHSEMRKYINYFNACSDRMIVAYKDNQYDIQELLKSSALLITDYSSVHFDFAYMGKPVIYYQFDQQSFDEQQYAHSIYKAERDGFGPVVFDGDSVEFAIEEAFNRNFCMEDVYYKRMRRFYELYDNHNCDRVYSKICQL